MSGILTPAFDYPSISLLLLLDLVRHPPPPSCPLLLGLILAVIAPVMQSPTMKDVARLTGYHPSTVSLALRGDRRITEATRELIKKAASQLGYRKNPLVSAWVSSRRSGKSVGPHISLAFLICGTSERVKLDSLVFRAAQEEAIKVDYHLTIFDLDEYGRNPRRLDQILEARGVQGLIIGSSIDWRHLRHFSIENYALVAIGRTTGFSECRLPMFAVELRSVGSGRAGVALGWCQLGGH